MSKKLETYLFWIAFCGADERQLNYIVETAANDDEITNDEYCKVYEKALAVLKGVK